MKKVLIALVLGTTVLSLPMIANVSNSSIQAEQAVWEEQVAFETELNNMIERLANGEFDEIRKYAGQFARYAKTMSASHAPESIQRPGLIEGVGEVARLASQFAYEATGGEASDEKLSKMINEINNQYEALEL